MKTYSVTFESREALASNHLPAIARKLKKPFVWLRNQEKVRRDLKQLSSFSDYELQDIGISRYDIDRVVRYGR